MAFLYIIGVINAVEEYPEAQAAYNHPIVRMKLLLFNVPPLAVQEKIKFTVKAFAKFILNS
jgi:hypothetical protein